MAYKKSKSDKSFVEETIDLWKTYSMKRDTWAAHAQEDREFRLGKQWTAEQKRTLEERGQAPIVVNRIHPAVEAAKAMLTSNRPSFRVSPREDSDNKVAQVMNGLLEYIWQISDGTAAMRSVIDDYYVTGMGALLIYQDPMSDMNRGDVKVKDVDPLDIYIDPNSRDRLCNDAESIIISRLYTKDQAIRLYPMYEKAIKNAASDNFTTDRPATVREDSGEVTFPEDVTTQTLSTFGESDEYIRGYERYYKEMFDYYLVRESFSGKEDLLSEESYTEYVEQTAWLVQGQVFTNPEQAEKAMVRMQEMYAQVAQEASAKGQEKPEPPQAREVSYKELIDQGAIEVIVTPTTRVLQCVVMGDKKLFSRVLPTEHYPVVLFMNMHTRTPFPMSDVRMVKNLQEYINKTRSLIIAHATTSTNTKILIPSGSVDMREFEQKWAQPGVAIEVDFDQGPPVPVQPIPLPNELYQNENNAKNDIDHQLGLYELMMGNSSVAPHTYKATVSLDEFGQRKIKSKQADIEAGLTRAAEIVIPMMQQLYRTEKVVRIVQPNNSLTEYSANKRLFDDKGMEIEVINDISVGKFDVVVVTGSTLPTNRYAQLEMYMDAYEKGIIDRQEVLKKTEVFDLEGVLKRTDIIAKLQQQMQAAQETIKDLQGDLQTREREAYHAKQQAKLAKFDASLDKTTNKAQAAGTVFEKRLDDAMGQIQGEVRQASKPETPSKTRRGSSK